MGSWSPYVIREGDHLPKLALRMGFDANAVWQSDENASLRKVRADSNMLCAGDVLYVPPAPPAKWLSVKVGQQNKYVVNVPMVTVSLVLAKNGKPIANTPCTVVGIQAQSPLQTDGAGKLTFEAPASLESVTVEIPSLQIVRRMRIGHLDPIDETSGLLQRLRNLNFLGPSQPTPDMLSSAVSAFQRANGLDPSGEVDADTRSKLESVHGC